LSYITFIDMISLALLKILSTIVRKSAFNEGR